MKRQWAELWSPLLHLVFSINNDSLIEVILSFRNNVRVSIVWVGLKDSKFQAPFLRKWWWTKMEFSHRLKELREYHGMTQADIAKCVNLSSAAIGNYEREWGNQESGSRDSLRHSQHQLIFCKKYLTGIKIRIRWKIRRIWKNGFYTLPFYRWKRVLLHLHLGIAGIEINRVKL